MSYEFQRSVTLRSGLTVSVLRAIVGRGTDWHLTVRGVAQPVGHAYTSVQGDVLLLGHLHVEPAVLLPHRHVLPRLRGHTEAVSLRRQGLGSELMWEVQAEARRRGLRGVTGRFAPEQPSDARKLTRFYTRHGFRFEGRELLWVVEGAAVMKNPPDHVT